MQAAMKNEEHDELWELLGKAREPKVAPFFSASVLRAVRAEAAEPAGFWALLRAKWLMPVTAGACAALALFFATHQGVPTQDVDANDPLAEMAAVVDNDDSASALDALIAAEDHSIWLEADPSSLF